MGQGQKNIFKMIKDYMNMLIGRGLKMPIKYFLEAHLFDIINKTDTHKRIVLSKYKYKTKNFFDPQTFSKTGANTKTANILENK